jgi:NAD-dependent DNA ligase
LAASPSRAFVPSASACRCCPSTNTYNEANLREFDVRIRRRLKGEKPQYVVEQKIDSVLVTLLY